MPHREARILIGRTTLGDYSLPNKLQLACAAMLLSNSVVVAVELTPQKREVQVV